MKQLNKRGYIAMIFCAIAAIFIMVIYNYTFLKSNLHQNIEKSGSNTLTRNTELLEGYLIRRMEIVSATATSIEFMLDSDASVEEIENFLIFESDKYMQEIDENFTGIYGYFDGIYLDGSGWTPASDYDSTTRDWYISALNANGETALVSPYVDAQTGDIMISISQMLSDQKSVVSLDIRLDYIQEITQDISVNGFGYGFILTENGMVVAHNQPDQKGMQYLDSNSPMYKLVSAVYATSESCFRTSINGEQCTIFADTLINSWKVVMIVDDTDLFKDARSILYQNLLVSLAISILIIAFFANAFSKINQSLRLEKESNEKVENMNHKIIRALVKTIDAKDRYTNGHSIRVAEYSKEIAKRMNKTPQEQETVYYAGLLHDVGKIRIPVSVINKPGKLTDEEFEQIKIHPVTSYHILKDIFDNAQIKNGAKFHHERYDGNGYPNGLTGENIPEIARIIGVADAYDAMASNRSYREALPQEVIRSEIQKGKGTQFDPLIADIMLEMINEDKDYTMKESNSHRKIILVVDDSPMNIRMVERILMETPIYEIIGVNSGREALEQLTKRPVDMILLDVMMPDMDGFETVKLIKEKYNTPVVFMTGDRNIETIEKASKSGVDDYLTKPFLPLALKEIVHSILN